MDAKVLFVAFAVTAIFLSGCTQQPGGQTLPPDIAQMKQLCENTGGSFSYCAPGDQCLVGTGCHCPSGQQFDGTLGCVYSQDAQTKKLCEDTGGRYNYCKEQACISSCICSPGQKYDAQLGCTANNGSDLPPLPPQDNQTGPKLQCGDWVTLAQSPSQPGSIVSQFDGTFYTNANQPDNLILMRSLPYRVENLSLGISGGVLPSLSSFVGKEVIITGELQTVAYEKTNPVSGLAPYRLKIYEIADANLNLPVPATRISVVPAGANVQTFRGVFISHVPNTPAGAMVPPAPDFAFYSLDFPAQIHTGSDPLLDSLDGNPARAVGVYSHYQLESQWLDEFELLKVQKLCAIDNGGLGTSRTREEQALFDLCISTGGNMDSCPVGTYCKVAETCACPNGASFNVNTGCGA